MIGIRLCILGALSLMVISCSDNNNPASSGSADDVNVVETEPTGIEPNGLPLLGNVKAKVTIIEYGDYQCGFCSKFFKNIESQIRALYVDIGKVKIVWRDFPLLGEESFWAAEAARCGSDQKMFWKYHDYLLGHQNGVNQGAFDKENLKRFAKELGLNQKEFDSCLDSGKYSQAVKDDLDAGRAVGVPGVPYFLVNDEEIVGYQFFDVFKVMIDEALFNPYL